MKTFIIGCTATGLAIPGYEFTSRHPSSNGHVLILGGVHGDEIEGVQAAHGLLAEFSKSFSFAFRLSLVPAMNLDGVLLKTRVNRNGVDLNRNLPTHDWSPEIVTERYHPGASAGSEPENKALLQFFENEKPDFIISLHSWRPMLNINGDSRPEAEAIAKLTGYDVVETIGYPTPGALGTYSTSNLEIPCITYEIERGLSGEKIIQTHVPALLAGLKAREERTWNS